jgi:two-component system phosphate regulon response regulator PhoB
MGNQGWVIWPTPDFWYTLLLHLNQSMKTDPSTPLDLTDSSFAKPVVLVVEDHADTRFLLKYLIEAHACKVVEAQDGEEALRIAEEIQPNLILMDTNLPRLDGMAATRRIRELQQLHDVPIIFLSGNAQPEYKEEPLASGGNAYFVKPISLSELERVIEAQLGRDRDERQLI